MKPERRCLREVMMPFSVSPESPFVQRVAKHVAAVRGSAPNVGVSLPSGYSGNDTSHLQAAGIPSCLYGPAGAPDGPERYLWASIDEMMTCARVYAAIDRRDLVVKVLRDHALRLEDRQKRRDVADAVVVAVGPRLRSRSIGGRFAIACRPRPRPTSRARP